MLAEHQPEHALDDAVQPAAATAGAELEEDLGAQTRSRALVDQAAQPQTPAAAEPAQQRPPLPTWMQPVEEAASKWYDLMRKSGNGMGHSPSREAIAAQTSALQRQLAAVETDLPSIAAFSQALAGVSEGFNATAVLAPSIEAAEAARKVWWAAASSFAITSGGGPDPAQNYTLGWASAINDRFALGLGWAYVITKEGRKAAANHEKKTDRTIDQWNERSKPYSMVEVSTELYAVAREAVLDVTAMPALAAALRKAGPAILAANRGDDGRPKVAAEFAVMAAAIEGIDPATTEPVVYADKLIDPALRAAEGMETIRQLAPHLRDDDDLQRAIDPLGNAIGALSNFGWTHATEHFTTNLNGLISAAQRLQVKFNRADLDHKLMRANAEMFDQFDGMYRALEQAEPEIPAARGLIDALFALEAAIESGRKPNAFGAAGKPQVELFIDGLREVLGRGPYGLTRRAIEVWSPLMHVFGAAENVGTVLGGESRSSAQSYQAKEDAVEDPAKTAALKAEHAPPPVDTREPAPDWVRSLAEAANTWLSSLRSSVHAQHAHPDARSIEEARLALRGQLEAAVPFLPAAQTLAWRVSDISETLRFKDDQLEMGMSRAVSEAEAARKELWVEAHAFAIKASGGESFEQNLTLQWLTAVDTRIADGIGWGYLKTAQGAKTNQLHEKQLDRSIDEWNTPEAPKPPPVTLAGESQKLLEAARAGVADPMAMPALIAALQAAQVVLATTARDPARKDMAVQCEAMAAGLSGAAGATPDELRANQADAIVDPALRAYEQMETLRTLAPHLDDNDLNRALDPLGQAFNYLRNFGTQYAPAKFHTDVGGLRMAADKLFLKVQSAVLARELESSYDGLFEPFDRLYRSLEQAELEVPAARPLITSLLALEAAITSGRKPNAYATAALAPLDEFLAGLREVVGRGPYGSLRIVTEIWSPLTRSLGFIESVGSVLGGQSRAGALDYLRKQDPAEVPEDTEDLVERHTPKPA
ncbi:MAG: hypothetical protein ABI867_28870 [Kofleriaceae bacterium]